MSEQRIQTKIIEYLRSKNYYVVKTILCSKAGVPDILACSPTGKFVAIEVKTSKGIVSKLQQYNIDKINEANGIAIIARSLDDVKKLVY